jgi:hypothetical protein
MQAEQRAVTFIMLDELGQGQVSEEVKVYIEGRLVADLLVNLDRARSSVDVRVPRPGSYRYQIQASGIFLNQFGQPYPGEGAGEGLIDVEDGAVFAVELTPHGIKLIRK